MIAVWSSEPPKVPTEPPVGEATDGGESQGPDAPPAQEVPEAPEVEPVPRPTPPPKPVPEEPPRVVRPHVLFEYEDPALEALSSGQKLLLRMGAENSARAKQALEALRSRIATTD